MAESKSEDGMTPLHRAAIEGDLPEVKRLLATDEGEALAHEMNGQLEYPLYSALFLPATNNTALKDNKEAIFRELLPYSSSFLAHQNRSGDTVLHRMAKNGFSHLVDDMISTKDNADLLSIENEVGSAPIHVAILNGRLGVVKQLLEQEGMPALLDNDGNLPLHLAAGRGSSEMVRICLKAYPEGINTPNGQNKAPFDLAMATNLPEVQDYLREQGAMSNPGNDFFDTQVSSHF
ncbi:MAG: ankyrin repeat domain-containing protein [Gammaproteobacteria bacterium]|nr:ankyrin repeat domain-containing protein [Gammaproteobacteria bacterium]